MTFSGSKGFVAGQESEALGVFAQQHGTEVAMAETDFAVFSDGAGDAEGLQTDTDHLRRVSSGLHAGFDGDGAADGVCPAGVLKADRLGFFHDGIRIDALFLADLSTFFDAVDAIFFDNGVDLINTAFVTFKQCHFHTSCYSCLGSMYFGALSKRP